MVEEKKNEEMETPSQPSEKENQGSEETPGTPETPQAPETPDYKAEMEGLEKRISEKIDKKLNEVWFNLRKVSKGETLEDEEAPKLDPEQIRGIVAEVVKQETGKIGEALKIQVSEITKSIASRNSKSSGGGGGGQKPPVEEGMPRPTNLSPDEEKAVEGMDWDTKKGGWVDRTTKQFYPHKRQTTSPEGA